MSEESAAPDLAELTRRQFEAWSRGDFDAVLRSFARDAVWETVSLGTSFEGVAAIRSFFEDWLGAYEEYELKPEEIVDLGNGVVFAVTGINARLVGSTASGLVRRRPLAFIWAEGLVQRVTAYAGSINEGRAAAERLAASRG
jgi:ketosteroid isomerase-like protein